MINYIIILVLALICGFIIKYLYTQRKNGGCVGCGSSSCHCNGGCSHAEEEEAALKKLRELRDTKQN